MKYVDGYVFVVPKKETAKYKKMAKEAAKWFKKNGAEAYFECIGDDLNPKPSGVKMLTFTELVKPKRNEKIWFSFVIYKTKAARNKILKTMEKQMTPEEKEKCKTEMPFDLKRMAFGGFKVQVEQS